MERNTKETPSLDIFTDSVRREFSILDQARILSAFDLMREVHANQHPRADGLPYESHPLDVAFRVLNYMAVKDPDLVIAALLHDSFEDQKDKLAQKDSQDFNGSTEERALHFLTKSFGDKVSNLVFALSNPDFESILKEQGINWGDPNYLSESNRLYVSHVEEAIQNPDVALIKYLDFSTNALRLGNISDVKRRMKLATKYKPVLQAFMNRFENQETPINISDRSRLEILTHLIEASQTPDFKTIE